MDNKEITFEQTFTPVSLVKFALPSVLVSVFTSLYPLVDGYFIKEYAGEIALGVGNLYYPVLCVFVSIGTMMDSGGNAELLACAVSAAFLVRYRSAGQSSGYF